MSATTSWFGGWSWIFWLIIIAIFFIIIFKCCFFGYGGYPYGYGGYPYYGYY